MADKASTLPETPVSGNLLTNDRDADSDPLHVAEITVGGATYAPGDIITIPGQGTLVVNRDGSYLFTPASGWSGFTPVLNYTLSDGNDGGTATGELRLLVNPVAEAWVKEAGLVDTASGAQTTTGAMAVLSLEPVESLTIGGQTLTLAQLQALSAQAPVDIATPDGVLSLTGFGGRRRPRDAAIPLHADRRLTSRANPPPAKRFGSPSTASRPARRACCASIFSTTRRSRQRTTTASTGSRPAGGVGQRL